MRAHSPRRNANPAPARPSRRDALRRCAALAAAAIAAGASLPARADDPAVDEADRFVALLRDGRYAEAVARFHYPPDDPPAAVARDRRILFGNLETLAREFGPFARLVRTGKPDGNYINLTLAAGEVAYWRSHPELARVQTVFYALDSNTDGRVVFTVAMIRPSFLWEVARLAVALPATREGARARLADLGRMLAPADAAPAGAK